ncbi:MAG: lysine--tRNA ligase [Bifidobacteriaceae bacterium]|nr:lysine--tRNA ligase [Bifidobacteriaceae bacterium]
MDFSQTNDRPLEDADNPDRSEQSQVRLAKRQALLDSGDAPYPVALPITTQIAAVRRTYQHLTAGQETSDVVALAGRVVHLRNTGKLCFAALQEGSGQRLQVMISLAEVGAEALAQFKALVDLGDHIFVSGRVISSKRGELSILVAQWRMAAKALRPLPVMHAQLSEEARVRERSADLIVNASARDMAHLRVAVVRSLRETLHGQGFAEIETPMLQTIHGGAAARPFVTHMNAFDINLYLRIAPELFLKRAAVGGFERVFEINRNFRNEGVDWSHSPEFAMLEAYQAYGDYHTIAELTRQMIQQAAIAATGSTLVHLADGSQCDLGGQWPWLSLYESLSQALGQAVTVETPRNELLALHKAHGLDGEDRPVATGKLAEELFEHLVGDHLEGPVFVCDYPVDTSPLVRDHRSQAGLVEKWDLYVRGFELATGYSELVDPVIQRQRFAEQARLAAAGDPEAMAIDEDFLATMEYGLPPTGGMGMGIDRLLMALTGLGIRETILFPLVKPLLRSVNNKNTAS